jgi:enoyl-CoA hydratase/carnithine racemase
MTSPYLHLRKTGEAAELILDKPAKRNALSTDMWAAIPALIAEAEADPAIAAVIIHGGTAGAFAAGADISEFEAVYATAERAAETADLMARAVAGIEDCAKPVIAAIEGPCVGGGVSVAAAADLRIAGMGSRFGVTPGKLGILYSPADTRRLVRTVGTANAKDLLFTGRLVDAKEAEGMGLVDRLVGEGEALPSARALVQSMAALSPLSLEGTKAMIRGLENGWRDDTPEAMALFLEAFSGEDFQEGYRAFLEKRKPSFRRG